MSEQRRFRAGETFRIPPMDYRVVKGKKGPDDLRLDWRWSDEDGRISPWRPVELDHVALIVDAIADNENVIHAYPEKGGAYVVTFVRQAFREGWCKARSNLHEQRKRADERRSATVPGEFSSLTDD